MGLLDSPGHREDVGFFPYIVFAAAGNAMPSVLGIVLTALVSGQAGLASCSAASDACACR
jgi:hypothetical protein